MRRLPTLATLAALLLLASACGGGSTPAATPGAGTATKAPATADAGTTEAPEATNATDAPEASEEAPTAAAGTLDLGGAADALSNLDSYKFRTVASSEGSATAAGVPQGGTYTVDGTVVLKPGPRAMSIVQTTKTGDSVNAVEQRVIGDTMYMQIGGDQWMAIPVDDSNSMFDSYSPKQLLASYLDTTDLKKVGDETKNGFNTEHYQSTDDTGMAAAFGLINGKWTLDVWVAKDGGYVVATSGLAETTVDGAVSRFLTSADILSANDPTLKVEIPDNVMVIPS